MILILLDFEIIPVVIFDYQTLNAVISIQQLIFSLNRTIVDIFFEFKFYFFFWNQPIIMFHFTVFGQNCLLKLIPRNELVYCSDYC